MELPVMKYSLQYGEDDRTRPLTEEGLRNRAIVVETLKGRQIDSFLSSPYKRSTDTIQTAADFFGTQIETDERFRERKVGTWESERLVDKKELAYVAAQLD